MSETATEKQKVYKPGERSITEIVNDLKQPVAPRHLRSKTIKGNVIQYLAWYDAVQYLDLYAPGWEYKIERIEHIKDKVVLVVRLGIPTTDGMIWREATGNEDDITSNFGDPYSNSESMAFRRACAKFGLGLYLYSKK